MVLAFGYKGLETTRGTKHCLHGASGAKPGNIVLFHDAGGDRSQTVAALEQILPALQTARV